MAALRKTLCLTAVLICAGCGDAPEPVTGSELPRAVEIVPGAGASLGPEDAIDTVDLETAADGSVHLTWREVDRPPGGTGLPEYRVVHARGTFRTGGEGDGIAWSEPEPGPGAASSGPAVTVARRGGAADGRFELRFEGLGPGAGAPGAAEAPRVLASRPASVFDQPAPRLLAEGETLHLLWAVNGEERRQIEHAGNSSETIAPVASVLYLRSDDGGVTWSEPVDLTAEADPEPQTIDSVEILPRRSPHGPGAGLIGLYGAHGLYAVEIPASGPYPAPRKISGGSGSGLSGGTGVRSLAAAGGLVAWIDDRFQESDRSLSKPLGGWPWSDSPDWADNDVLVLDREQVETALVSGHEPTPRRLTGELSFAEVLRARPVGDGVLLAWAGRSRVGKNRSDGGEPPRLFTAFLGDSVGNR